MTASGISGHFLHGESGQLAVIVHHPPPATAARFGALYLPPFGDEMNKSRRTVALQARALTGIGGVVALLDPRGTGDSAGDHGIATWHGWQADAAFAWEWLVARSGGPCLLWGLRLGALLAAQMIAERRIAPAAALLWQPVSSGRVFFNQLLRVLALQSAPQTVTGRTATPRATALAAAAAPVEVAGYELSPGLVSGIQEADLARCMPACPVIWRETSVDAAPTLTPASCRIVEGWRAQGCEVDAVAVEGPSFWAAQEIESAPQLIASSTAAVAPIVDHAGATTS